MRRECSHCARDLKAPAQIATTIAGTMNEARAGVADRMRWQAQWCARLGSPLYADLLEQAAAEVERGGPVWTLLEPGAAEPSLLPGAQALRLMGAVHRLVLEGRAPELARFYPSAGGTVGPGVHAAFSDVLAEHQPALRDLIERPVQTNEVGRAAALLGGFLTVAAETGMPLRLLEVGASAGLNLRWDRYFYTAAGDSWGDAGSSVRFEDAFGSGTPPLSVRAQVAERRGCDPDPLDPAAREDRLTLLSYVWPDQEQRVAQLRAALELASSVEVPIDRAEAVPWLERQLSERHAGVATVVFHSIVLPYLGEQGIAQLAQTIRGAGERADAGAPLAWLSMEAGGDQADVRLTTWPGGDQRLLARATYHGPPVTWLG
jgi:hypothetical protein